jgi:APA family basic amino acid/polyamine antiporter
MLWMMYYLVVNRPLQSLAGFAMMLSGLAIYAVSLQLSKVGASESTQTTGSQTIV